MVRSHQHANLLECVQYLEVENMEILEITALSVNPEATYPLPSV